MADRWQGKLSRPIVLRDGTKLVTLAEADGVTPARSGQMTLSGRRALVTFSSRASYALRRRRSWLMPRRSLFVCPGPAAAPTHSSRQINRQLER
jgi:hypothetical protein